jgi:hypothetical protein
LRHLDVRRSALVRVDAFAAFGDQFVCPVGDSDPDVRYAEVDAHDQIGRSVQGEQYSKPKVPVPRRNRAAARRSTPCGPDGCHLGSALSA